MWGGFIAAHYAEQTGVSVAGPGTPVFPRGVVSIYFFLFFGGGGVGVVGGWWYLTPCFS